MFGALVLAGCDLCAYRDDRALYTVDVGLDEECPPPPPGRRDPPDDHGLVSVDGPATREIEQPAHESCCYRASFELEGAQLDDELCTVIELPGRGDEQPTFCAEASDAAAGPRGWTFTHDGHTWSVDEVTRVEQLTEAGPVSLRRDGCAYPATFRSTADACG